MNRAIDNLAFLRLGGVLIRTTPEDALQAVNSPRIGRHLLQRFHAITKLKNLVGANKPLSANYIEALAI